MIPENKRRGSSSLAGLLEALEKISEQHPELFDTDVRERAWDVVYHRVILAEKSFQIPKKLGLFSEAANQKLVDVLQHHLNNLSTAFEVCGLKTKEDRIHSFQNPYVKTAKGLTHEDFFGSP